MNRHNVSRPYNECDLCEIFVLYSCISNSGWKIIFIYTYFNIFHVQMLFNIEGRGALNTYLRKRITCQSSYNNLMHSQFKIKRTTLVG